MLQDEIASLNPIYHTLNIYGGLITIQRHYILQQFKNTPTAKGESSLQTKMHKPLVVLDIIIATKQLNLKLSKSHISSSNNIIKIGL